MRDISQYETDYTNYSDMSNQFEDAYQVKYRQINVKKQIEKYAHGSILEIGCGMNTQANVLENIEKYTIVEPAKMFTEKAQKDLEGKQVIILEGLFEEKIRELQKTPYEFVIIGSLLQELENVDSFLEQVKKVCNSKTVIHVNVPNAKSFHRLLAIESGIIDNAKEMSERNITLQQNEIFDLTSLRELILKCDGDILDSGSYFVKPFTHLQMMRCLDSGIINDNIVEGFNRMIKYMPELGSEIYVNFRWRGLC